LSYASFTDGLSPQAIALDAFGNLYFAGNAETGFAAKLRTADGTVDYVMPVGTSGDRLLGITVDRAGKAWIVGSAASRTIPVTTLFRPAPRSSVLVSEDQGSTWRESDFRAKTRLLTSDETAAVKLIADPDSPARAYVVSISTCAKTEDAGHTWTILSIDFCLGIAVNPRNSSDVYAVAFNGSGLQLYSSNDHGDTFHLLGSPFADFLNGRFFTPARLIVIDPQSPDTIYVGMYKTTDRGQTWSVLQGMRSLTALAISPQRTNTLCGISSEGVHFSIDGGVSWSVVYRAANLRAIAFNQSNSDIVYAAGLNGFVRSLNGGVDWSDSSTGLPNAPAISDIGTNATHTAMIYISSSAGGLYRSADGGVSWTRIGLDYALLETVAVGQVTQPILYTGSERVLPQVFIERLE